MDRFAEAAELLLERYRKIEAEPGGEDARPRTAAEHLEKLHPAWGGKPTRRAAGADGRPDLPHTHESEFFNY